MERRDEATEEETEKRREEEKRRGEEKRRDEERGRKTGRRGRCLRMPQALRQQGLRMARPDFYFQLSGIAVDAECLEDYYDVDPYDPILHL